MLPFWTSDVAFVHCLYFWRFFILFLDNNYSIYRPFISYTNELRWHMCKHLIVAMVSDLNRNRLNVKIWVRNRYIDIFAFRLYLYSNRTVFMPFFSSITQIASNEFWMNHSCKCSSTYLRIPSFLFLAIQPGHATLFAIVKALLLFTTKYYIYLQFD